jgi:hypothetical protein
MNTYRAALSEFSHLHVDVVVCTKELIESEINNYYLVLCPTAEKNVLWLQI